jgi:hypothetical protein
MIGKICKKKSLDDLRKKTLVKNFQKKVAEDLRLFEMGIVNDSFVVQMGIVQMGIVNDSLVVQSLECLEQMEEDTATFHKRGVVENDNGSVTEDDSFVVKSLKCQEEMEEGSVTFNEQGGVENYMGYCSLTKDETWSDYYGTLVKR